MEKNLIKFDWPKEAELQMVEMWQEYPCLYNPKDNFYHNKHARYSAFNAIAEKLNTLKFEVGVNEIKHKMSYLRGQYTREVAKVRDKKSGAGAEENYIPTAYWYNELTFLQDYVKIRKGGCNLNTQTSVHTDDSLDSSQAFEYAESPQPNKRSRLSKGTPQSENIISQEERERV